MISFLYRNTKKYLITSLWVGIVFFPLYFAIQDMKTQEFFYIAHVKIIVSIAAFGFGVYLSFRKLKSTWPFTGLFNIVYFMIPAIYIAPTFEHIDENSGFENRGLVLQLIIPYAFYFLAIIWSFLFHGKTGNRGSMISFIIGILFIAIVTLSGLVKIGNNFYSSSDPAMIVWVAFFAYVTWILGLILGTVISCAVLGKKTKQIAGLEIIQL